MTGNRKRLAQGLYWRHFPGVIAPVSGPLSDCASFSPHTKESITGFLYLFMPLLREFLPFSQKLVGFLFFWLNSDDYCWPGSNDHRKFLLQLFAGSQPMTCVPRPGEEPS